MSNLKPVSRDLAYERGLPASLEAERYLLGSILAGMPFQDVDGLVEDDDFSLEKNRRVFAAMRSVAAADRRVDHFTVGEELRRVGHLESVDGLSYLLSLDDGLPQSSHAEPYIKSLKEKADKRRLIFAAQKVLDRCFLDEDTSGDIIEWAESTIKGLGERVDAGAGPETVAEIVQNYPGGAEALLQPHLVQPGIQTPWSKVNHVLRGLKPGKLYVLAGRPGFGKTAWAMQVAQFAGSNGESVDVFSLEMGKDELLHRMVCSESGIDFDDFMCGRIGKTERDKIRVGLNRLASYPLRIDDRAGLKTAQIGAALRRSKRRGKLGMVVIDYLQLVEATGKFDTRNEAVAQMSRYFKLLAKELNVPILLLSQLNREVEKDKRKPKLSDLRESGSIEQDADVVMFIHPANEAQEMSITPHTELLIRKHRGGRIGTVDLTFYKPLLRFEQEGSTGGQEVA